jgi:glycosyltransferase involved in cell wall biosynthesis
MRLRAEREFSLANVADRYENLYREVLATRP